MCPSQIFKETDFVLKNRFFDTAVGVPAENFGLLAKKFRQFCENCFCRVQRKNLKKNKFSSRSYFGRIFFDFRRENSGSVVKIALYESEGNFLGISSLDSNFLKPFWILAKSSRQVFKVSLSMSTGISSRKCFFHAKKVSFLHHLRSLVRKNIKIRQKFLGRFVEIPFYGSSGKLKGKPSFEKIFYIFPFSHFERFVFLTKNLKQGCHNTIVNVQGKKSRKGLFLRNS